MKSFAQNDHWSLPLHRQHGLRAYPIKPSVDGFTVTITVHRLLRVLSKVLQVAKNKRQGSTAALATAAQPPPSFQAQNWMGSARVFDLLKLQGKKTTQVRARSPPA